MGIIKSYFGQNLKRLRKKKGYSQECLAERVGVNRRQLTRVETGRSFPSFETLEKICDALGIHPAELFNFEEFYNVGKTGTDDEICYVAVKRPNNVILLKEKLQQKGLAREDTNKEIQVDNESKMFEWAKKINKKVVVEYWRDDVLVKTEFYYPDGRYQVEGEGEAEDLAVKDITEKIKKYKQSLPKLRFIQLALECLEDKTNAEKMKNVLDGMML